MEAAMMRDRHDLEDRHWWFRGRRHAVWELGRRLVPPGGEVVQVGCGTGGIIGAFPASVARYGLDPSPAALATARARYPGVTFELGAPPEAGRDAIGAADLVILCDVLEHIYDDAGFISELLAGMRSGAHLLLTVPTVRWPRSPDGSARDSRRYTRHSLARTWRGLPVSPRLVAPLNRRLHPVVRTLRTVGAWPPPEAGNGVVGTALPWSPVNAALGRVLVGEVRALIAALKTSPRQVPGHGTSLLAVLECAAVPVWEDAGGSGGAAVVQR
jgi:SAM-dependent methyltransferase